MTHPVLTLREILPDKTSITTSDGPVTGPGPETNQPTSILKGPRPTEDRIKTDRAITSDGW